MGLKLSVIEQEVHMKTLILVGTLFLSAMSFAQTNQERCGRRAYNIATEVHRMGLAPELPRRPFLGEAKYEGELTERGEKVGVYSLTFADDSQGVLMLDALCFVVGFRHFL